MEKNRVEITLSKGSAFDIGMVGAVGALVGILVSLFAMAVIVGLLAATMEADDVRAVCARHGGVAQVDDDNGLLLPVHLVICRDGWVDQPKP